MIESRTRISYVKIQALESRQEHLSDRVDPILEARLNEFVQEIPKTLGPTITEALKNGNKEISRRSC